MLLFFNLGFCSFQTFFFWDGQRGSHSNSPSPSIFLPTGGVFLFLGPAFFIFLFLNTLCGILYKFYPWVGDLFFFFVLTSEDVPLGFFCDEFILSLPLFAPILWYTPPPLCSLFPPIRKRIDLFCFLTYLVS